MPSAAFLQSLPFILRWEGGYVNHPADPGGATNRGVTQKVYDAWRANQGLAARTVKLIEDAEVGAIYEGGYWVPPYCPELPSPLDLVQFDSAVNMGPVRAVRFLQQAVGAGVDGVWGNNTRTAVNAADLGTTLTNHCDVREAYYRNLAAKRPAMKVFLKGWLNRLDALRGEAGLPGVEAVRGAVDFGDADHIARLPDFGEDPDFD